MVTKLQIAYPGFAIISVSPACSQSSHTLYGIIPACFGASAFALEKPAGDTNGTREWRPYGSEG